MPSSPRRTAPLDPRSAGSVSPAWCRERLSGVAALRGGLRGASAAVRGRSCRFFLPLRGKGRDLPAARPSLGEDGAGSRRGEYGGAPRWSGPAPIPPRPGCHASPALGSGAGGSGELGRCRACRGGAGPPLPGGRGSCARRRHRLGEPQHLTYRLVSRGSSVC